MYDHLNLRAWPFQVTPDPEFAEVWAGRPQIKNNLDRLLWKMQFTPKSSLHLLWANFGMGKTHTLMHLQHICRTTGKTLIPVFAVMPRSTRRFLEVYRAIVLSMPYDYLGDQLVKIGTGLSGSLTTHPTFADSPGVVNAILAMRKEDSVKRSIARQWLIAQPGLTARDLRTIGVSYRIKTPEDAISSLTTLTKVATSVGEKPTKLVVMIDEYQRIGEWTPKVRSQINAGIHGYFDQNPKGLEIILTFSFGKRENVEYLLSAELKSRSEPFGINLDVLTRSEATAFVRDLLMQFRINEDDRWAFPFSSGAVDAIVNRIAEEKSLTPRRLMLYANHVLLESQMEHGPDYSDPIQATEAKRYLADPQLGAMDTD